jgi:hypothetical protein
MTTRCRRAWALGVAVAAALTAAPAGAQAARLDDGATRLTFAGATFGALRDARVEIATLTPATAGRLRATFPVTGGNLNPVSGRGFVSHRGTLVFRVRGTRRLAALSQLRVTVRDGGALTARVGGDRLTVARLRGAPRADHDADFARVGVGRLVLTPAAAAALNRALGVGVFAGGLRLGRLDVEAHLAELVLAGGYTALTPDAGTVAALTAAGLTLEPLRGTDTGSAGEVILPVVSGLVERASLVGRIRHAGGLVIRDGDTRVALANFNADVSRGAVLTALTAAGRLPVADLALPDAGAALAGRRLTVAGVGLTLTTVAAEALNEAFGTEAFAAGLPLGTAVIRARVA